MYAMILRESAHIGNADLKDVTDLARESIGADEHLYRADFIRQVERTKLIVELASR
jgi:hypothetical protein